MSDQTNEIQAISSAITEIGKNLESNYITKTEYKAEATKLADAVAALNKAVDRQRMVTKAHPIFGSMDVAKDFIDCLRGAMAKSDMPEYRAMTTDPKSEWFQKDTGLNSYTSGSGAEALPTSVSSVFSYLVTQGGVARRNATVIEGVQGTLNLPRRTGVSSAAFTVAGGVNVDDLCLTPTNMGVGIVSLTPQQIAALALVSDKLLYASAINLAEFVAMDLAEGVAVLEDNSVIRGDGTPAFGHITGITNDPAVPTVFVNPTSGFANLDALLSLPGMVHESVQKSPNAKYYASGKFLASLRSAKATTAGMYFIDPTTGSYNLGGYPVEVWQRLQDASATGNVPVIFGDLRKGVVMALGRDMNVRVSTDFRFGCTQTSFRIVEDVSAAVIQPTAMAKAKMGTAPAP